MNCLDVEKMSIFLRQHTEEDRRRELVQGISFSIAAHESLAVIGGSGSGKTLTALSIMGILDPDLFSVQGRCSLFGTDVMKLSEKERKYYCRESVAMVYQNPFRSFSPVETLCAQLHTVSRLKQKPVNPRLLNTLFSAVHLNGEKMLHKYPYECSGGELQRLLIVFALLFEPKLLICDEPSSALDYQTGIELINLLNSLKEQNGMSLLFITHDISLIKDSADKIVIMKDGSIVESGAAQHIFEAPQHQYTRLLIEAAYLEKPC